MEAAHESRLRGQLVHRRARLRQAIREHEGAEDLVRLLREVDSALDRMDAHSYGECLVCHESVGEEDLLANPLIRYCLCSLTPEQQSALENDLELASRIQAALLPEQDQVRSGWEAHYRYEPAGIVSGDYCDLLAPRDGDGDLYFSIGDVSGKGVAASLLMAHLNASFRALGRSEPSVLDLTHAANTLLLASTLPSNYATLVCGKASRGGALELCNAGHCPPLLARDSGVEALSASGPPIGLFRDAGYETLSLELEPGDSLLLYTDGLTEARSPDGEEYGAERLSRFLGEARSAPLRILADGILGELRSFSGARQSDDRTLVILRRVQ
jgi:sigma-B regulation protein RsbU (phosphoserine phosphatase)